MSSLSLSVSHSNVHFIASKTFMRVEHQFLKWILDWEKRVFPSSIEQKGRHLYSFSVAYCRNISDCIRNYQTYSQDYLGQDRLAWTVFAKALLKEHSQINHRHQSCTFKKYLFLSLWISFYLDLPNCKLVEQMLRDILICSKNFKFLFTFLPGMNITQYISTFLSKGANFEDIMCKEFFSMICGDNGRHAKCNEFYYWSKSLIHFLVKNLTPLHETSCSIHNGQQFGNLKVSIPTMISVLDQQIHPSFPHNLLTLAIQFTDLSLIEILLKIGASAGIKMWDPVKEVISSGERTMISIINSVMSSQQFLSSRPNISGAALSCVLEKRKNISHYSKKLRRSLLKPESCKADNIWNGERWRIELNKEIADEWGISCKRPLLSLQHIAKICIRKQILDADHELLPRAITRLPIPFLMKQYLNLELD